MLKINKFILYLAIFFQISFWPQLTAEIPFTEIKGLYTVVNPKYNYLSPLNGFNWWKTKHIENMYRFGTESDATIKLIQDIFYLQGDDVTFDVTTLNKKPAKHFTAATIGKILALLLPISRTEPVSEDTEKELAIKLKSIISDDINFEKLVSKQQKKVEELREKFEILNEAKKIDTEKKKLTENMEELNNELRKLEKEKGVDKTKRKEIVEKLAMGKKQITDLNAVSKKLIENDEYKKAQKDIDKENLQQKSLDNLVSYIIDSIKETIEGQNQKYITYATDFLFLACLWKKADSKSEFLEYFRQFPNEYRIVIENLLSDKQIQENWLKNNYSLSDYDQLKKEYLQIDLTPEFISNNYEDLSFYGLGSKALGKFFPPIISSIGDAKFKYNGKIYEFNDCGETSLRNFFDILIYNRENKKLDVSILTNLETEKNLKLNSGLIEFYSKPGHDTISNLEVRSYYDDWTYVVSNLPNVSYHKDAVCEINPGITNLLRVLNNLIFGNDEKFEKIRKSEKLDILVEKLSRKEFKINWRVKNDEKKTVNDKDTKITLIFTINEKIEFEWEFLHNHFVIKAKEVGSDKKDLSEILATSIKNNISFNLIPLNLLGWFNNIDDLNLILEIFKDKYVIIPYYIDLYFSQNLKNNENKLKIIKDFANLKLISSDINNLIGTLIKQLPNDTHFNYDAAHAVISNKMSSIYSTIKDRLKNLQSEQRKKIIEMILSENIEELFDILNSIDDYSEKKEYIALIDKFNIQNKKAVKWNEQAKKDTKLVDLITEFDGNPEKTIQQIEKLLSEGGNIETKFREQSLLMTAISHSHPTITSYRPQFLELIPVIKFLIEKGANVNYVQYNGETTLMAAASINNEEIVKLLIEKGANVNAEDKEKIRLYFIA